MLNLQTATLDGAAKNATAKGLVYRFSWRYILMNVAMILFALIFLSLVLSGISPYIWLLIALFLSACGYFLVLDETLVIYLTPQTLQEYRCGRLVQTINLQAGMDWQVVLKKRHFQSEFKLLIGNKTIDCSSLSKEDFLRLESDMQQILGRY